MDAFQIRRLFLARAALVLALVFVGALFWARQRDPFQRLWFEVRHAQGAASCVAVLPKTQPQPLPVVIFLHGSGGSVHGSGNDLRCISEMGIAAVGMDYCQTNDARFETEFAALLDHVRRQPWADTNRVGWLGYSLGAQRQLIYALQHTGQPPALLARLGGGMIGELQPSAAAQPEAHRQNEAATSPELAPKSIDQNFPSHSKVLIVHGELDEVFPTADAEKLANLLRSRGASVDYHVLEGQGHGLGENRAVVFRRLGEYFLTQLSGNEALQSYRSIHSYRTGTSPLWPFMLPGVMVGAWFARREASRFLRSAIPCRRSAASVVLWSAAIVLGLAAILQASLHIILPRMDAGPRTVALARRVLVQASERGDFDYLARGQAIGGRKIGELVEHAHLANYNRQLVNWEIEDPLYREYVLSPQIGAGEEPGKWRRTLWESCYPRVRNCPDVQSAAAAIARHLRERVTIAAGADWPLTVTDIWRKQITNADGFNAILMAALRACGIPARLDGEGHPEFWTGAKWERAPEAKPTRLAAKSTEKRE